MVVAAIQGDFCINAPPPFDGPSNDIGMAVHHPTSALKHGGLITEDKTVAGGLIFLKKIWQLQGILNLVT